MKGLRPIGLDTGGKKGLALHSIPEVEVFC